MGDENACVTIKQEKKYLEKIKIKETVVVEGKYDKIKLSSVLDANILTTDGFRIYKNDELIALLRALAVKTGLVVITDSDSAGRKIRGFIGGCVKDGRVVNVFLPKVRGKEKRKNAPSKEGFLGVEGLEIKIIRETLERYGIAFSASPCVVESADDSPTARKVTKTDLYEHGLAGRENSAAKRKKLFGRLKLPDISANALVETVNLLMSYEEYEALVTDLEF